jgi:hypothetical protein
MSSGAEDTSQHGRADPGGPSNESRPGAVRAVLRVRGGARPPFEGIFEVGLGDPRSFHGWLELMGLVEEARSRIEP